MNTSEQKTYNVDVNTTQINLVSLFASLLRFWKTILIWGIVFCLLGAAFGAYLSRQDDEGKEKAFAEYNRALKNYNDTITAYEKERAAIQADIDDIYNYLEKSILLKINPYKEAIASADVLLEEDSQTDALIFGDKISLKNEKADKLLGIYTSFLNNGISYKDIAEKYETEDRYIRELVGFEQVPENGILHIFVRHTDQDIAMEILKYILTKIEEQKNSFSDEVPEHNYTVINLAARERVDTGLITQVEELRSGTSVIRNTNSLYSKQLALVDDFNARIELIDDKVKQLSKPISVEADTQLGILKFAALGFLGGVILYIILLALRLIIGRKLLDRQPLMLRFNLRMLAAFPHNKRNVFDRLADRLLVSETGLTQEEVYKVALNSIRRITGNEKKNILIAAGKEIKGDVCRALQEGLASKDSVNTYTLVPAFGNNLHTQQALEECDYVVILAEIARTRQEAIANVLSLTEQYGKIALGVVLYN